MLDVRPVHYALFFGNQEAVKYLLECGAKVDLPMGSATELKGGRKLHIPTLFMAVQAYLARRDNATAMNLKNIRLQWSVANLRSSIFRRLMLVQLIETFP